MPDQAIDRGTAGNEVEHHQEPDQSVDSLGNPRSYQMILPAIYWIDHTELDCAGGDLLKWSGQPIESEDISAPGRRVLIRVSIPEIEELVSRANYYATLWGNNYTENRRVSDSARRTLGAIERWFAKNPEVELESMTIHLMAEKKETIFRR
jgi:hypothetical protein